MVFVLVFGLRRHSTEYFSQCGWSVLSRGTLCCCLMWFPISTHTYKTLISSDTTVGGSPHHTLPGRETGTPRNPVGRVLFRRKINEAGPHVFSQTCKASSQKCTLLP